MNMRHTLNWKLIVGLGIIALAVVAVAPKLAWGLIPLLFIALCPLMMFLMMRGMGMMGPDQNAASPMETRQRSMPEGTPEEQLPQLTAQNEALARQIAPIDARAIVSVGPELLTVNTEASVLAASRSRPDQRPGTYAATGASRSATEHPR